MLVNISYSIDFDEVPKIVKGFLENDVHTELTGQVTEAVNEAICALEDKNENTVRAIQKVEQIREALVKLDMRLSDCSSILKGLTASDPRKTNELCFCKILLTKGTNHISATVLLIFFAIKLHGFSIHKCICAA